RVAQVWRASAWAFRFRAPRRCKRYVTSNKLEATYQATIPIHQTRMSASAINISAVRIGKVKRAPDEPSSPIGGSCRTRTVCETTRNRGKQPLAPEGRPVG